jgi:peptidoglycan/xylan/chitin deacetylase (PgdA/CDA1 family)
LRQTTGQGVGVADRRLQLARLFMSIGLRESRLHGPAGSLLVVNYHRLRPAMAGTASEFDDGVFGPDVTEFRRQMEWLRHHTSVLSEETLADVLSQAGHDRGAFYSLVTFDDAYVDCYSLARPVLDELGIKAIFFAPITMIDARRLGWWDLAAYLLKKCTRPWVRVSDDVLDLRHDPAGSLRRVLNMFKLLPAAETDDLLEKLSDACEIPLPGKDAQSAQLMTWEHLREMARSGHGIGSHTFSHRVLATLTVDQQSREIRDSRRELENRIGGNVHSLAYPVGGTRHINLHSVRLAREAGYTQAFTFNTGIATLPVADCYRVPRESAHSFDLLRAKVLMPRFMGIREKRAT